MVLICDPCIADTDDDSYRPSKRTRADFRQPIPSDDDQSSPGRSQRGHSREDVPMTDQTEGDGYEVLCAFSLSLFFPGKCSSGYIVDLIP